jgi:hypothetical protein
MDERDDIEMEDDIDEQLSQMIVDNGVLLHALVNILFRKGIITQEELDAEASRLFDESDEDETDG